jgi:spermidine synthase
MPNAAKPNKTSPKASQAALEETEPSHDLPEVTLSEHEGVRYLHLGTIWIQGGMRIRAPQQIELHYIQRMLASLLWLPADEWEQGLGHAVQLGLGAGAITRFTADQLHMATTAVELNPQVVQVNASHFHLPQSAEVVVGDAAAWLRYAKPRSVRLLHVDLYDEEAAAPVLDSVEFYTACRAVLEEGGLMSANLFGRAARFAASIHRVAEAFGADQVWSMQPTREGNTAVVAGRGVVVPGREELADRARRIEDRFGSLGLKAKSWLHMVRPYQPLP